MAKKGQIFKKYSAEFKLCVILDMREHGLDTEKQRENIISGVALVKVKT